MPRIARIITDKHPCHITQRGNNRQDVFLDDEDRKAYLTFLKALAKKYSVPPRFSVDVGKSGL
jgi:putative transposase